jgi:hydrogenase/urease accessory protein HupE
MTGGGARAHRSGPGAWLRPFAGLLLLLLAAHAAAHTADTSYARVRIFDDGLEIRLTYDVFTLAKIAPGFDANRDQAISREELRRVALDIQEFLASHVGIEINGAASKLGIAKDPFWPLDVPDPIPASLWHTNEALISFPFDLPPKTKLKDIALIFDVFAVFGERHTILGIFEYRGEQTQVTFSREEPDFLFDTEFAANPAPARPELAAGAGEAPPARRSNADDSPAWRFFKMGVEHILTGYDHLCFLLALLVVSRLKPLIAIVTSFTIAHSITLLLAAFGIVTLPTRWIECAIAVTIVYVALENLWRSEYSHRWMLTFFFGLIHGFGFANTLDPQELPIEAKAKCLVVFNLGVEAGQLAVVLVFLPVSLALARWQHGPRAKVAISLLVALLGTLWFVDRVFALGFMPF